MYVMLCECPGSGQGNGLQQRVFSLFWLLPPFLPFQACQHRQGEGCVLTERHGTIKVHEKGDMIVYACDPSSGEAEAEGSQV